MIYAGDEFGNSQNGNNNAYCQDNETGWLDWSALRKNRKFYNFICTLINFRHNHKVLHIEKNLSRVIISILDFLIFLITEARRGILRWSIITDISEYCFAADMPKKMKISI